MEGKGVRGREGRGGEGREGRPGSVPLFSLLEVATLVSEYNV